jgi:hypothetical protein
MVYAMGALLLTAADEALDARLPVVDVEPL